MDVPVSCAWALTMRVYEWSGVQSPLCGAVDWYAVRSLRCIQTGKGCWSRLSLFESRFVTMSGLTLGCDSTLIRVYDI